MGQERFALSEQGNCPCLGNKNMIKGQALQSKVQNQGDRSANQSNIETPFTKIRAVANIYNYRNFEIMDHAERKQSNETAPQTAVHWSENVTPAHI